MLPAMARKLRITIVGPGRLGTALALELSRAGYAIPEIVSRRTASSRRKARALAKLVGARSVTASDALLNADLIWFCVPDRAIAAAAGELARFPWKGKVAFHSSGALSSRELLKLRSRGAAVASVHPFMTFVRGAVPSLKGVPIAVEGDAAALRASRQIARSLSAELFSIREAQKSAYHAWGAFTSPLVVSLLVTAERVARAAGHSAAQARRRMLPIIAQTLANYARLGPAGAFSGPLVRGDVDVVRRHLQALRRFPEAAEAYRALSKSALRHLPVQSRRQIQAALSARSKTSSH